MLRRHHKAAANAAGPKAFDLNANSKAVIAAVGSVEDTALLAEAFVAEENGKGRKTVLEAISNRIEELAESEGE